MKMVVGAYNETGKNEEYGSNLGRKFSLSSSPYSIELVSEGRILSSDDLAFLAGISAIAKKPKDEPAAADEAIVDYIDKDGTYHRGTQKAIDCLKKKDALTPESANNLKKLVARLGGKTTPVLEQLVSKGMIKSVEEPTKS